MADSNQIEPPVQSTAAAEEKPQQHTSTIKHVEEVNNALTQVNTYEDDQHVPLGWRSWLVVLVMLYRYANSTSLFCACWQDSSNVVQVYVVVATGTVIAFIIRDLGEPGLAGWAIQGPLLSMPPVKTTEAQADRLKVQSAIAPIIGRLSDVMGRKALAVGLPLISFAGACVCARSTNVNQLIGGSILTGFSLATLAIVLAIPSEVLPLKYRTISNGSAFLGGAFGGL
jgi:MFS family permease